MAQNTYPLTELKVLLVEDSFDAMNLTKHMLHDIGVTQIFTAKNGVEALTLLDAFDDDDFVDVVLCDWNMPRLTGLGLLKQIRSCDLSMPFLMITGQADLESVTEAKAYGVTGYLKKPFSADELRKKVTAITRMLAHRDASFAPVGSN
jgi:two-component system chemotaxis response regulator CheY